MKRHGPGPVAAIFSDFPIKKSRGVNENLRGCALSNLGGFRISAAHPWLLATHSPGAGWGLNGGKCLQALGVQASDLQPQLAGP